MLFDNNSISIDGPTNLAVSDNFKKRFNSYDWEYIEINGHDEKQIYKALKKVQKAKKPTVISCKTIIGYGSPNKSGSAAAHGSPLGNDEINLVRKKLKWKSEPFKIPKQILNEWREIGNKGSKEELKWKKYYYKKKNLIEKTFSNKFKNIFEIEKKKIIKNLETLATRKSSELVLTFLAKKNTFLIGGSADLAGSNNTKTKNHKIIKPGNFKGNYIHYGVREHAMCGIMNGLALHSSLIPYGGTFLIFSDYCKPSIRLSAFMKQRVIYVMSHDSIGLGEDGPTHQPVEHLAHLRAIPNLNVFRPADIIETLECWEIALKSSTNPSVIALSRQKIPFVTETLTNKNMSSLGGYELKKTNSSPEITLIASGSEVQIAIDALNKLKEANINSKVISMPCQELFDKQSKEYREQVIEKNSKKISIEASSVFGWEKYVGSEGSSLGIKSFGKSAPYKAIYEDFNLTSNSVVMIAKKILGK